jgi:hypothetical protein
MGSSVSKRHRGKSCRINTEPNDRLLIYDALSQYGLIMMLQSLSPEYELIIIYGIHQDGAGHMGGLSESQVSMQL